MRRTDGLRFTPHEMRVLAATLHLDAQGDVAVKGADLWQWLQQHEDRGPSAATVYRALRRLTDEEGLFLAHEQADTYRGGKPRVYYTLTPEGRQAARRAWTALAARRDAEGIRWLRLRPAE